MQNEERVEVAHDDMPEEEELYKLRLDYKDPIEATVSETQCIACMLAYVCIYLITVFCILF